MSASMDMFPRQLRRSGRRELLILAIAVTCCLIGLFLVTEVSARGRASPRDWGDHTVEPSWVGFLSFGFR